MKAIGTKLGRTISSGKDGNKDVLKFLDLAKKHLSLNGRIYLVVFTVSDYRKTIDKMISLYDTRLIAHNSELAKEYVDQNIDWYLDLNRKGKIFIYQEKNSSEWLADQYLFELRLKAKL